MNGQKGQVLRSCHHLHPSAPMANGEVHDSECLWQPLSTLHMEQTLFSGQQAKPKAQPCKAHQMSRVHLCKHRLIVLGTCLQQPTKDQQTWKTDAMHTASTVESSVIVLHEAGKAALQVIMLHGHAWQAYTIR